MLLTHCVGAIIQRVPGELDELDLNRNHQKRHLLDVVHVNGIDQVSSFGRPFTPTGKLQNLLLRSYEWSYD